MTLLRFLTTAVAAVKEMECNINLNFFPTGPKNKNSTKTC